MTTTAERPTKTPTELKREARAEALRKLRIRLAAKS